MACRVVKLSCKLKELRFHLCQKSKQSDGVRKFIEKYYVPLKKENPRFPILIRECSGVQPVLWVRYEYGEEKRIPLDNLEADEVWDRVKSASC